MFTLRKSGDRGFANHGWLRSHHTFSFGHYYDPNHMQFGPLRVINEDRVEPGQGFPLHGHRDMEIITYVIDGALQHKDKLGNGSVIAPGDVQRMSAGTGIRHSEYNHSNQDKVHFLQIWIEPAKLGNEPSYEQKTFPDESKTGRWCLVGSNDGRDGSVVIHQDVSLYSAQLQKGSSLSYETGADRLVWLQAVKGVFSVNGHAMSAGDGAGVRDGESIRIEAGTDSELLLFDMTETH